MSRRERLSNVQPGTIFFSRDLYLPEVQLLPPDEAVKLSQISSKSRIVYILREDIKSNNFSGSRNLLHKKESEKIFDCPVTKGLATEVLNDLGLSGVISLSVKKGEKDRYKNLLPDENTAVTEYHWDGAISLQQDDKEEMLNKLERIESNAYKARQKLINANLRLVVSIAKKYPKDKDSEISDHISNGTFGLMHAAEKFDWRFGYEFSTYATGWIKQSISRGMKTERPPLKIPINVQDAYKLIEATIENAQIEGKGENLTPEKVIELIAINGKKTNYLSPQLVDYLMTVLPNLLQVVSLHSFVNDGDSELINFIQDKGETPEEIVTDEDNKVLASKEVEALMSDLDEREREVIKLRYGLGTGERKTLEAIGKKFKCTRENVRQIEARAKSKMKRAAIKLGKGEDLVEKNSEKTVFNGNNVGQKPNINQVTKADLLTIYKREGLSNAAEYFSISEDEFFERMRESNQRAS